MVGLWFDFLSGFFRSGLEGEIRRGGCHGSTIARVRSWLNLGDIKGKPRASRKGKFWQWWVQANDGRSPGRRDRMTPRIFQGRIARVEVGDTNSPRKRETRGLSSGIEGRPMVGLWFDFLSGFFRSGLEGEIRRGGCLCGCA
jgi:hypothetical protein